MRCAELLVVCTGNAARSVMAGVMLQRRCAEDGRGVHLGVTTAGTHAVEGQPVSWRTHEALVHLGLAGEEPGPARHRSRQLVVEDIDRADVVIGMETDHVRYVRRLWPQAAARTATLRRLCRDLPHGRERLARRVRSMRLEQVNLEEWEDVADPAGGELDAYLACAKELWDLSGELARRL